MKWGKKKLYSKSSSTSSSRPSFISHVFPISWISKFKQKSRDVETKQVKVKHDEGKWNSAFMSSQTCDSGRGGEKFYGGEGDGFWRLSFGDEGIEGKSSKSVPSSVWYNSQDDFGFQPSTCKSCGSNATTVMGQEEIQMFDNLNLDTRKIRGLSRNLEILPELGEVHEALKKTSKVTTDKEKKLKKINPRVPEEEWSKLKMYSIVAEEKSKKSIEKDNLEFGRLRKVQVMQGENCRRSADFQKFHYASSSMSKNCNSKETEEDGVFAARSLNEISAAKTSSEWEVLKQMKINELKSKSENQRKSLYVSRELQRKRTKHISKVKVSSPRLKALEDMKKAKLKMKKGKEKTLEGRTGLESFAVVTTSFDPQKDFRDSMNEMIIEKKISQPEELEELLACYLTLNSDEYHDLIIKVFRQVWFDMNRANFDNELQNEKYFS